MYKDDSPSMTVTTLNRVLAQASMRLDEDREVDKDLEPERNLIAALLLHELRDIGGCAVVTERANLRVSVREKLKQEALYWIGTANCKMWCEFANIDYDSYCRYAKTLV